MVSYPGALSTPVRTPASSPDYAILNYRFGKSSREALKDSLQYPAKYDYAIPRET